MKKSSKLKALDGRWKLTANHDLILKANQTKDIAANSLSLKGKIVEAGADFLTFKVRGRSEKGKRIISFLKLKGIWRSDRFNRITFQVKRKIRPETFIFEGAWDINKQQRVVYSYQSVNLKTRKRIEQTIVFDGFWQINQKSRVRYIFFNIQV